MNHLVEPHWIEEDVIIAIHERLLAEFGGLDGIRDRSLLQSALTRPRNRFSIERPYPSVPQLASSYAAAIIQNHPFNDGNKRVAWTVCRMFLALNGFEFSSPKEESYLSVLRLVEKKWSEVQFEEWLDQACSLQLS